MCQGDVEHFDAAAQMIRSRSWRQCRYLHERLSSEQLKAHRDCYACCEPDVAGHIWITDRNVKMRSVEADAQRQQALFGELKTVIETAVSHSEIPQGKTGVERYKRWCLVEVLEHGGEHWICLVVENHGHCARLNEHTQVTLNAKLRNAFRALTSHQPNTAGGGVASNYWTSARR